MTHAASLALLCALWLALLRLGAAGPGGGSCTEGSWNGPAVASSPCVGGGGALPWFWVRCPVAPCSSFTTCNACVGQSECGWCADTNQCLQGSVVSPNNAVCSAWQFSTCPGVAPGVTAFTDNAGTSLTLLFDLDMVVSSTERPCSAYLANVAALGTGARCYWVNARKMTVLLGSEYGAGALTLDLTPGVAASLFVTLSGVAPIGAIAVAVQPSRLPQAPIVVVQGPSQVTLCDTSITLDGSATTGVAIEPLGSVAVWTWSLLAGPLPTAAITDALATRNGVATLTITPNDLAPGVVYTFQLRVQHTVAGVVLAAVAEHAVVKNTAPLVDVTITSPSSLTIYASDELILRAHVSPGITLPAPCGPITGGRYNYAWTKVSGPIVALDTATQITSTYRLPPNTLTGYDARNPAATEVVYVFQCAVDLNDALETTGRATVTVRVRRSPLVALPAGMQLDTRLTRVAIDGGAQSEDADAAPVTPAYAWDCTEVLYPAQPCVVTSQMQTPVAQQRGLLEFPGSNLHSGNWLFQLVFSKGALRARTTRTVTMDWDDSPSGAIAVVDPSRLQFPSVGSAARRLVLVNAREPLVLRAGHVRLHPGVSLVSWRWSSPSGAVNLATASIGSNGAYLFFAPNTLVSGRAYDFLAVAVDSAGLVSRFTAFVTVNDEPRSADATGAGGCRWATGTPTTVNVLRTVLTVECSAFTDDSAHYPLGYALNAAATTAATTPFQLFTGFSPATTMSFVLPVASAAPLQFSAVDSLGAPSATTSLALPVGTTVVAAFPGAAAGAPALLQAVATAICCGAGSLADAVDVGSIERINQVAYGTMEGITTPGVALSSSELATMRASWLRVMYTLDKRHIVMPSHLWAVNQGVAQQMQTRAPVLLNATLQLVALDNMRATFERWPPGTKAIAEAFVPALTELVSAMDLYPSDAASAAWVNRTWTLLVRQGVGGAAVAHSTVAASYSAPRLGTVSRNDTFDDPSYVGSSAVPRTLDVVQGGSGRQHRLVLSDGAARVIAIASPLSHGLQAWAVDANPFAWEAQRLALASDVVGFQATRNWAPWAPIDGVGPSSVSLTITPALYAAQPANTSLVCARWVSSAKQWSAAGCVTPGTVALPSVQCECDGLGIFALVWSPLVGSPGTGPLLPLGPSPAFTVPWLPIVVLLLLLLLLGLLLTLYFCLRPKAPPLSVPLEAREADESSVEPLSDWTTHLRRPNRLHIPGKMPHDTAIIFYDATSSGEDNWPSDDQPDREAIEGPPMPRPQRVPFVGGRVALMRETGRVAEADSIFVAPVESVVEAMARNRALGVHDDDVVDELEFSSDSAAKLLE